MIKDGCVDQGIRRGGRKREIKVRTPRDINREKRVNKREVRYTVTAWKKVE